MDGVKAGVATSRLRRGSWGSSFHYSFGLLPAEQRRGIESLYAFCRVIDDVADEGPIDPAGAAAALGTFRDEIGRCYTGNPKLSVTRALQGCIVRFGIERQPFEDLLEGVAMDLYKSRYATFEELRLYCSRVASAVGLICLRIFDCRHPDSRVYAMSLGIALQLTNILRDLKADAALGRVYLPRDEIDRFGYSETELLRGACTPAFLSLMRHQAERAHRHFEDAAAALPAQDKPRLLAAEVMGAIYRRLLRRIEETGFRVFERRIQIPRLMQIGLALRARATGQVGD